MPDVSGVCLRCCVHVYFPRGIFQQPWPIRRVYSSWRILLANQVWIQQLKNISDRSSMDTAAEE
jgi:hypothetical protein